MASKFLMTLVGVVAMTASFSIAASEGVVHQGSATPTTVLVRAHKLIGQDEFHRERVLFTSDLGVLLSANDVTQISTYLNPVGHAIPEGAYHSLRLELANEALIYGSPDGPVVTRLRNDGRPEVLNLSGVIRVTGSEVTPLALALDSWPAR